MWTTYSFFPTDVYRNELPGWTSLTEKNTLKYFDESPANAAVFQTANLTGDKDLAYIEDYFLKESLYILDRQGYDLSSYNFYVGEMWGQLFNYGGYNFPHVHPGSIISGLYFFSVPESETRSDIIIHDSRLNKTMADLRIKNTTDLLYSTTSISLTKVIPGTFLIFNSWLTHNLTSNLSSKSLKFLHFNLYYENKR